jgi:hypothetical protein
MVRIVNRAEHSIAMQLQLVAKRRDEAFERTLVTSLGSRERRVVKRLRPDGWRVRRHRCVTYRAAANYLSERL